MPEAAGAAAGRIETATGSIAPADLGPTLMHEHILCDVTPPGAFAASAVEVEITPEIAFSVRYHWCRHYGNQILNSVEIAAAELRPFAEQGGSALVELTTRGLKPDPAGLRQASERSGVRIVVGTGFYVDDYAHGEIADRPVDALAAMMIADLRTGFGDSGIRAGIIGEIGVSNPWRDTERRVMAAAVVAQRETGAAISVHPGRRSGSPLEIVDFVRREGGDLSRLIIGHLDRTLASDDQAYALLDTGCVGEWDFFGIESSYYPFAEVDLPNDGQRINLVRRLLDRGHGGRIALSQDICTKTRLTRWGGHGYAHLLANVVPMMRRKGFAEAEIDGLLVQTPRRLLTLPR